MLSLLNYRCGGSSGIVICLSVKEQMNNAPASRLTLALYKTKRKAPKAMRRISVLIISVYWYYFYYSYRLLGLGL